MVTTALQISMSYFEGKSRISQNNYFQQSVCGHSYWMRSARVQREHGSKGNAPY